MNEEDFEKIQAYRKQLRRFQGTRLTTKHHKDLDGLEDVQTALTAAGIQFTKLKHSGNQDPPGCEAIIDGIRCGIEVTELVHRPPKPLNHHHRTVWRVAHSGTQRDTEEYRQLEPRQGLRSHPVHIGSLLSHNDHMSWGRC